MRAILIMACMALAGCSSLPGAGPTTGAMRDSEGVVASAEKLEPEAYALVPMTIQRAKAMNAAMPLARAANFVLDEPPPRKGIGSGDALEVTIISVNPSGFVDFSQSAVTPIATNTLPVQEVDASGTISVPPLGRVGVRGMSVREIESMLVQRLAEVLVDPSVVVRVTDRISDDVSVVGEVANPGRHSIGEGDPRLFTLIGAAGGPTLPPDELRVTLTRNGRSASVRLDRLMHEPRFNIRVWPGDVITVSEASSQYTVFGATNRPGAFEWRPRRLTLASALAEGGGGNRLAADRSGVFVLRNMPRPALAAISDLEVEQLPDPAPAVLQFDFSSPTGMLAAQQFEMRNDDLVYVSDSPIVDVGKIAIAFSPFLLLRQAVPVPVDTQ